METHNGKLFSSAGHLTHEAMLRYHGKRMSREDQYAIEKHIAGCSLCAEALEGAEKIRKETQLTKILAELRRSVRKRNREHTQISFFNQNYVVAAIVFLILFLLIIYLVFFRTGLVK